MDMTKCQKLNDFFGYFHQDWALDSQSYEDVIKEYVSENQTNSVNSTILELEKLLDNTEDANSLSTLDQFGCYYYPPWNGDTVSGWLGKVLDKLKSAAKERE